ncbi:MAG: carboxymuconolactone decarboxylase family protein [Candidatus Eremiobacteraeota bacterium]|nr:carboxymuconolactone decarboxylase family protein [Candidatus Eremiobacteraeota bacterium]
MQTLNLLSALAVAPELERDLAGFIKDLDQATLDPKIRALARLAVSRLNECPYDIHHHELDARQAGVEAIKLEALRRGQRFPFDQAELLVIQLATRMAGKDHRLPIQMRTDLLREFGQRGLVELCLNMGLVHLTNRCNQALGIELEANAL